ncbi:MAG: EF-P beta-lysylation protein EpmB, partial [Xanthomonadales bacterium]|nr:EF-P beta-lysylation protein EpmB [Xanthomonadales bacterium]
RARLGDEASSSPAEKDAHRQFPVLVPPAFSAAIAAGGPPLLRQVAPDPQELQDAPGFVTDPVGDLDASAARGVIHKYHGRLLLIATGACAIHCRYCFRRHFPYASELAARDDWAGALAYLASDETIREVILSGGDPLTLSTAKLKRLTDGLEALPHVRRIRIHSRIPCVLPERIDAELLDWLATLGLQVVLVLHANHPAELLAAGDALQALRDAGVTLLNQAVLLRGVNDDPEVLVDLQETLFAAGVLPYYLHMLDPVAGAAHFAVPDEKAQELMHRIRCLLPGFLVPRLVREMPGAPYKIPLL